MRLIVFVAGILILFAAGCSTEQLQTAQAITHSVAYPADANVIVFDPNDPNSALVMQIADNVEKILDAKTPISNYLVDVALPMAGTYGGWLGFAAMVANAIRNRKKKV